MRHCISLMFCLCFPTVLKLLKMAVGMRALLDTVMQALPQVYRQLLNNIPRSHSLFPFLPHLYIPLWFFSLPNTSHRSCPQIYIPEAFLFWSIVFCFRALFFPMSFLPSLEPLICITSRLTRGEVMQLLVFVWSDGGWI